MNNVVQMYLSEKLSDSIRAGKLTVTDMLDFFRTDHPDFFVFPDKDEKTIALKDLVRKSDGKNIKQMGVMLSSMKSGNDYLFMIELTFG